MVGFNPPTLYIKMSSNILNSVKFNEILELSSQTKKLAVNVIVNVNVIGQPPTMAHFRWRERLAFYLSFTFTISVYRQHF